MIDLPGRRPGGAEDGGGRRRVGAEERVYYCGGAAAMLAVRAADPGAEIALTWTTLAPPRPACSTRAPAVAQLPLQPRER